jgi:hypothetical protein
MFVQNNDNESLILRCALTLIESPLCDLHSPRGVVFVYIVEAPKERRPPFHAFSQNWTPGVAEGEDAQNRCGD